MLLRNLIARRRHLLLAVLALTPVLVTAQPAEPTVILDMDAVRHQPATFGQEKTPVGTVELVEGKFGQACRFSFVQDARAGFFTAWVNANGAWDAAAGLSFWVKGDGSQSWGGLELIDGDNYALRYGYCFPIDSTEWRKITVPWRDLLPELPAADPVDPQAGYQPSRFRNVWFGKWWYWGEYPAHSYAIDQLALEPSIPSDTTNYTPAGAGTPRLLAKLEAKQPVTIVTMGDSLSAKEHWANREVLWSNLLAQKLTARYGGEVKVVNPAIGGTTLNTNLVLMPRWLKGTPKPDLVTVWFGFNDWDAGARHDRFVQMLALAVERIRRMTGGESEVLLMTTCPAIARWDTMEELAQAAREVAAAKRTGLADMAQAFHAAGKDEAARKALYVNDETHLGPAGHSLAADTVLQAIAEGR